MCRTCSETTLLVFPRGGSNDNSFNPNRFINHEKSKKHKEMVALIKAHMEEEDRKTMGEEGEVEEVVEADLNGAETLEMDNEPQR